jgi:hypothetical protein
VIVACPNSGVLIGNAIELTVGQMTFRRGDREGVRRAESLFRYQILNAFVGIEVIECLVPGMNDFMKFLAVHQRHRSDRVGAVGRKASEQDAQMFKHPND